ncbi:ATP synthase d subunit [Cantharellus anzutake]|uniref:ATP synthase d subunit n=1 Tax=Cantharellus anzutake TaxID=1750568 RepID=UPI001907C91C|nr:ATP synthase d subunit [Cantharellus anzutake]KAF8342149.1 ATP synthase d subunit [Cantharellus anzutake]
MAATRSAAAAVDFARIYSSLGLGKETIASLQAFRKRHAEAQRVVDSLKGQPTTVDIAKYRSTLRNQEIVAEAEKLLKEFRPVTYDVNTHVKAIETFEAKALAEAQSAAAKVDEELAKLQATLENIQQARPFQDLTVDDVSEARPQIRKTVETMLKKGKWTVPGYTEKFGDLSMA